MSKFFPSQAPDSANSRRVHLAVIEPRIARALLAGSKIIESRLSRTRRAPFGQIEVGDRVYFLARRVGLSLTGCVTRVLSFNALDECGVLELRQRFGAGIAADDTYWERKRDARYATLMWFDTIERAYFAPDDVHGRERSYRSAWIVRPGHQCVYPKCCEFNTSDVDRAFTVHQRQSMTILPNCSPASSL